MTLNEEEGSIDLEICCQNYKLESYWSGEWLSKWTLSNGQLFGSIKLQSHYYEIGNLQFNLSKEFEAAVQNPNDADSIVKAIKGVEDKVSDKIC